MNDADVPPDLVEARRTPLFDIGSLPEPLAESHRTTVWGELRVQAGTVRYIELEGDSPLDVRVSAGEAQPIPPGVEHRVDPATDATFYVQFFREPQAPLVPGPPAVEPPLPRRSGPWEHRGRDLDDVEEVHEMVTRLYVDITQDELLGPYFEFGPGFMDWLAHIGNVTDYWAHVLLFTPDYQIDTIEHHRPLHEREPFTPELFDRWLQIFEDTIEGGWSGPISTRAVKRATGMAWAMAQRFLGHGAYRPPAHRS